MQATSCCSVAVATLPLAGWPKDMQDGLLQLSGEAERQCKRRQACASAKPSCQLFAMLILRSTLHRAKSRNALRCARGSCQTRRLIIQADSCTTCIGQTVSAATVPSGDNGSAHVQITYQNCACRPASNPQHQRVHLACRAHKPTPVPGCGQNFIKHCRLRCDRESIFAASLRRSLFDTAAESLRLTRSQCWTNSAGGTCLPEEGGSFSGCPGRRRGLAMRDRTKAVWGAMRLRSGASLARRPSSRSISAPDACSRARRCPLSCCLNPAPLTAVAKLPGVS